MVADAFANVKVVLVEPSHPGNIGAAARAMKTMGLSRLALVRPEGFPSADATARASGADDLLHAAQVAEDLGGALADCALVVGTSARARNLAWPEVDPRQAASLVLEAAASQPVAVVFGRERTGLTNTEVERCHYLLRIPTSPGFTSLNLAAAVQVVAYEIWVAAGAAGQATAVPDERDDLASGLEMEGLLRHFEQAAVELGFLDPQAPKRLRARVWRLFNRARPDRTEVNILRGFLKAAQIAARRAGLAPSTTSGFEAAGRDSEREGE
jgi:TrmH family RNA methyltransferase